MQLLDDFLAEEGIYEDTNNAAIKRVLSYQLEKVMEELNLTKVHLLDKWAPAAQHWIGYLILTTIPSLWRH